MWCRIFLTVSLMTLGNRDSWKTTMVRDLSTSLSGLTSNQTNIFRNLESPEYSTQWLLVLKTTGKRQTCWHLISQRLGIPICHLPKYHRSKALFTKVPKSLDPRNERNLLLLSKSVRLIHTVMRVNLKAELHQIDWRSISCSMMIHLWRLPTRMTRLMSLKS